MQRRYKRFLLVRDNFYPDPETVRRLAMSSEFHDQEDISGYISSRVYHPKGIRQRLESFLGLPITRWDTDTKEGNGCFYTGFSAGKLREVPAVHADEPFGDVTVVVYLTPGLPPDCGTSLWRHKATGLEDGLLPEDARRLKIPLRELRDKFERDSTYRNRWIEIDRAGYRYNRAVAYASGMLHSATRHCGADLRHGRIYQTFRLGVDWSHSRIHR